MSKPWGHETRKPQVDYFWRYQTHPTVKTCADPSGPSTSYKKNFISYTFKISKWDPFKTYFCVVPCYLGSVQLTIWINTKTTIQRRQKKQQKQYATHHQRVHVFQLYLVVMIIRSKLNRHSIHNFYVDKQQIRAAHSPPPQHFYELKVNWHLTGWLRSKGPFFHEGGARKGRSHVRYWPSVNTRHVCGGGGHPWTHSSKYASCTM